ncbi:2OG-Fe dioxygenase family protein [Serratia sp. NPDC078593]|uniref:2OG-Fe dioxygenase family protein n=1 Tax=unclassified Serratia (in: enterobacteria) TaxID=2647522 RepID=UPI0037CE5083
MTALSPQATHQLMPSFAALPQTQHADGKYRLRRYSVITLLDDHVKEVGPRDFVQSDEINHFQGNVVRHFEPIDHDVLQSAGMAEMCKLFAETNALPEDAEIEIHQMRVVAIDQETQVAPEGIHQDGFDHIAMIAIHRQNIVGGEIMLYTDNHQPPFFKKALADGEAVLLADNKLWHNATPISTVEPKEEGHLDIFVLTARGDKA